MGHPPREAIDNLENIRRSFKFEPLEPRLLFDATLISNSVLTPVLSTVFPVFSLPIGSPPSTIVPISINGLNGSSPLNILDNRQAFSGTVATFTDTNPSDPSTYSATINWGDGSPADQGIIVADPAGGFDILGSHTYVFGQYTPAITITAPGVNPGDAPRTLTISSNLSVFPPPTACEAFPISAANGQALRGTIATYTGLDTTQLNRYSASINWGDGQQSTGQLVLNPDGSVSVLGQHVYASPGFDDVEITITANGAAADIAAATAFCRATVANGFCAGNVLNIFAESGAPYTGNLAFFQFLGSDQNISNLTAQIILSGPNGAPITIPGTIVPGDNGFYVAASTVFTCDFGQSIQVRVYDSNIPSNLALGADSQLVGLTQGYITVTGHLTFTPQGASMTAGFESRVLLGHLTSDDPTNLWNKTFDVQINWGDGSDPSEGQALPNPVGGYDIYGTHTYPVIGWANNYSFYITITETRTTANPSTPAGPFTYTISGGTDNQSGTPVISVAAGSFAGFFIRPNNNNYSNNGVVSADLYLGADLFPKARDIIATVNWSDGITTPAFITQDSPHIFSVFSYRGNLPVGGYTAVLSVTIGQYHQTANFSGYIAGPVSYLPPDYSLHARIHDVPVNAFVGDHFHGTIATFTVPGPPGAASDYNCNAWIPGAINLTTSIVANNDGSFSIVADFDSMNPGTTNDSGYLPLTIYRGDKYTQAPLDISITNDPTRVTLTPENDLRFRQRELFTTTVATFTAPSPDDTPADYTATIDWGDGNTTTGTITEQYNGVFDISGAYGYVHNSGSMILKITVTDSAGRSIFTYSNMYLDVDPVSITPGTPTIQNGTVSGNMANFIDDFGGSTDPSEYRVYHATLIDWGDGTVTNGLITTNPDGTFSIASTHDYQADGDYQIHILVRRNTFYAWQPFQPISLNGFGGIMAFADANTVSTITADPDSDFGVTYYVHVVGTADRPTAQQSNPPTSKSTSVSSPTNSLFSIAAVSPLNPQSDPILINSQIYTSSIPSLASSNSTNTWLATDSPLLDSSSALLGIGE